MTVGVLILLAAAYPVLGLRTGNSGAESLPADTFAGAGAQALERSFPGNSATEPAQVVISGEVTAGDIKAAIARLEAAVADDPDFGPSQQQVSENGQVALVSIPLIGPPDHRRRAGASTGSAPTSSPLRSTGLLPVCSWAAPPPRAWTTPTSSTGGCRSS